MNHIQSNVFDEEEEEDENFDELDAFDAIRARASPAASSWSEPGTTIQETIKRRSKNKNLNWKQGKEIAKQLKITFALHKDSDTLEIHLRAICPDLIFIPGRHAPGEPPNIDFSTREQEEYHYFYCIDPKLPSLASTSSKPNRMSCWQNPGGSDEEDHFRHQSREHGKTARAYPLGDNTFYLHVFSILGFTELVELVRKTFPKDFKLKQVKQILSDMCLKVKKTMDILTRSKTFWEFVRRLTRKKYHRENREWKPYTSCVCQALDVVPESIDEVEYVVARLGEEEAKKYVRLTGAQGFLEEVYADREDLRPIKTGKKATKTKKKEVKKKENVLHEPSDKTTSTVCVNYSSVEGLEMPYMISKTSTPIPTEEANLSPCSFASFPSKTPPLLELETEGMRLVKRVCVSAETSVEKTRFHSPVHASNKTAPQQPQPASGVSYNQMDEEDEDDLLPLLDRQASHTNLSPLLEQFTPIREWGCVRLEEFRELSKSRGDELIKTYTEKTRSPSPVHALNKTVPQQPQPASDVSYNQMEEEEDDLLPLLEHQDSHTSLSPLLEQFTPIREWGCVSLKVRDILNTSKV